VGGWKVSKVAHFARLLSARCSPVNLFGRLIFSRIALHLFSVVTAPNITHLGTVPAFADQFTNFGGGKGGRACVPAIASSKGRRLGFAGDDTWGVLWPDSFDVSHSFFSFDVLGKSLVSRFELPPCLTRATRH
jgi:hypothetical protein